jgi:crotonobetainyl-CoA:carnitine CoA-transferase CaiB-like acyl-CoA transferase
MVAFGGIVSLLARKHHGGQRVSTSLAAVMSMIQTPHLVRFAGRPLPVEGGRDFAGPSPIDRIYAVEDGWIRIHTGRSADEVALLLDGHHGTDDENPAVKLARAFASVSQCEAVRRLNAGGVAAVPVRHVRDVAEDADLVASGLFRRYPEDGLSHWVTTGEHASFSRTPPPPTSPAPRLGQHTVELLEDAGLDQVRIDLLLSEGVAAQAPAERGRAVME